MCQLDMRRACAHVVSVCVCGVGGLQKGGLCRYRRRTFNLHSDWAWKGVRPYHMPASRGITPTSSPETQAVWADFGSATWTQGVVQNKPAAAQRCLEREGEGRERSCWAGQHIQHSQDKQNTVLQDKKKRRGEPTYSRWVTGPARKHGGLVEQGGVTKDFHW